MHTMWKGSVSFGLVNVPVRMFAATESKDVKFRYLHKECQTPIQYTRTCPSCQREVNWDEIVRGFEYEPNRFVIMDEKEMEAVQRQRAHTIDITDFVQLSEIDPVYYDKSYYLSPETSGSKAYQLLRQAMEQTNKIAIARTVLRNSETLCCLRVFNEVLVMETLFWPDEVRSSTELPNLSGAGATSDTELDMAITLINQLARPFNPEKYRDERRDEIMGLIQSKVANQQIAQPATSAPRENIVDLMQALQESIRQATPTKQAAGHEGAPAPRKRTRKRTS